MRTLGKIGTNLIHKIIEQDKVIFTLNDALKITESNYKATAELMRHLIQRHWLVRLNRGKYLIITLEGGLEGIPSVNRFLVAKALVDNGDYFISYYSAMEIHGLLTQPLTKVYTTIPKRLPARTVLGTQYQFITAKQDSFWGMNEEWVSSTDRVKVSNLERTILDALRKPDYCGGITEVAKGLWIGRERIDYSRMRDYVAKLGNKAVAKRLGYLLELYGAGNDEIRQFLKKFVDANYSLLDPMLPNQGMIDSNWRLRLNVVSEELQAVVRT